MIFGTDRFSTDGMRGIAVVFLTAIYLLTGALHGLCDLDVTNPSGGAVVVMAAHNAAGPSDKGAPAAEHHCHGCFPVSMPAPVLASAWVEPDTVVLQQPRTHASDTVPALDTPPPKFLS